ADAIARPERGNPYPCEPIGSLRQEHLELAVDDHEERRRRLPFLDDELRGRDGQDSSPAADRFEARRIESLKQLAPRQRGHDRIRSHDDSFPWWRAVSTGFRSGSLIRAKRRGFYQQGGFMQSVPITGYSSGFGSLAAVVENRAALRYVRSMDRDATRAFVERDWGAFERLRFAERAARYRKEGAAGTVRRSRAL